MIVGDRLLLLFGQKVGQSEGLLSDGWYAEEAENVRYEDSEGTSTRTNLGCTFWHTLVQRSAATTLKLKEQALCSSKVGEVGAGEASKDGF